MKNEPQLLLGYYVQWTRTGIWHNSTNSPCDTLNEARIACDNGRKLMPDCRWRIVKAYLEEQHPTRNPTEYAF